MKQLLIRADDLGYSYAIDLGIARTVHEGVVRSVGLMPNMPEASRGWSLVDGADVAVGQEQPLPLDVPTVRCGTTEVRLVMESMRADYVPARDIRRAVERMEDGQTVVLICHPGYLDEFALATSSLTRARTQEAGLLVDPAFREWLDTIDDLRLVDYRDL